MEALKIKKTVQRRATIKITFLAPKLNKAKTMAIDVATAMQNCNVSAIATTKRSMSAVRIRMVLEEFDVL